MTLHTFSICGILSEPGEDRGPNSKVYIYVDMQTFTLHGSIDFSRLSNGEQLFIGYKFIQFVIAPAYIFVLKRHH